MSGTTKKPYVRKVRCLVLADHAFKIRCPGCHQEIKLREFPVHRDGFRFAPDGTVREMVVCLNLLGSNAYCDWEGHVRLHKQVHTLQEL